MRKIPKIFPSILSSNVLDLRENLELLEGKFNKLHIDIIDGLFVKNFSFGPKLIEEINTNFNFEIDLHLMVMNPLKNIDLFKRCGISSISIHYESLSKRYHQLELDGIELGLALNPSTPIPSGKFLEKFDYIVILGVNPGFGGQEFIPETLIKLQRTKKMLNNNNLDLNIQCDGGINKKNINNIIELGSDQIVIGSGIFQGNLIENISFFNKII